MDRFFCERGLKKVEAATTFSEELVNNHFKLSSGQWLNNRYDIKTARELDSHERVVGPYAQVLKYEGKQIDSSLGSAVYTFYLICLQDSTILSTIEREDGLQLEPFLGYVLVHELVHIVRFLLFQHRYGSVGEADVTLEEERRVHDITHRILRPISMEGMEEVFEFYKKWVE